MPAPGEHKTVQTRILAYAEEVGWIPFGGIPREEAERLTRAGALLRHLRFSFVQPRASADQRGQVPSESTPSCHPSLFFDDLLDANVREFNPRYGEAEGALPGQFPPSPKGYGGTCRNFVEYPRDRDKFFDHEEKRERDLNLSMGN
jgi:type I restriction enzyme, R subunit